MARRSVATGCGAISIPGLNGGIEHRCESARGIDIDMNSGAGFGEGYLFGHYGATEGMDLLFEQNQNMDMMRGVLTFDDLVAISTAKTGVNEQLMVGLPRYDLQFAEKDPGTGAVRTLTSPTRGITLFDSAAATGGEYALDDDYFRVASTPTGTEFVAQHHSLPIRLFIGENPRIAFSQNGYSFIFDGNFDQVVARKEWGQRMVAGEEHKTGDLWYFSVAANYTPQTGQTTSIDVEWWKLAGVFEFNSPELESFALRTCQIRLGRTPEKFISYGSDLNHTESIIGKFSIPLHPERNFVLDVWGTATKPRGGDRVYSGYLIGGLEF